MTKQELVDKYRDWNVDSERWHQKITEELKERMSTLGFVVEEVYFSGFWSQGDGACFTGYVRDWAAFCDNQSQFVETFPEVAEFLRQESSCSCTIKYRGPYYHRYSVQFDWIVYIEDTIATIESDLEEGVQQTIDDVATHMRLALYKKALSSELSAQAWVEDFFRNEMLELYRTLEEEYEYQTSDEAVWESLKANDMTEGVDDGTMDQQEEESVGTSAERARSGVQL